MVSNVMTDMKLMLVVVTGIGIFECKSVGVA